MHLVSSRLWGMLSSTLRLTVFHLEGFHISSVQGLYLVGSMSSHTLESISNQHRGRKSRADVGGLATPCQRATSTARATLQQLGVCDRGCIWAPKFLQYCTTPTKHHHHPKSGQRPLRRLPLVPPHAHVADPRRDNPFVDVGLSPGFEPTFGLKNHQLLPTRRVNPAQRGTYRCAPGTARMAVTL